VRQKVDAAALAADLLNQSAIAILKLNLHHQHQAGRTNHVNL
jgi:hypothetical protein